MATLVDAYRPAIRRKQRRFGHLQTEELFHTIWQEEFWDARESKSGAGSTLEATETIRRELPLLVERLCIRSLLDAPCGDYHWMRQVDLPIERYLGADIVSEMIALLQAEFAGDPRREFLRLDITMDPLPAVDGLLCRDCLIHLSNRQIQAVLDNSRRADMRYLMFSNYPTLEVNRDIRTGLSRPVNLCAPPFGLPAPLIQADDPGPNVREKVLAVWERAQIQ